MTAKPNNQITFTGFNNLASKEDEIAFIHAVAEVLPQGSYLASLLRPAALDWIQGNIKNDIAPDFMDAMQFKDGLLGEVNAALKIAETERTLETEAFTACREALAQLENERNAAQQTANVAEDRAGQWYGKAEEYNAKYLSAQVANEKLQRQVIELKARLYDFEHSAE